MKKETTRIFVFNIQKVVTAQHLWLGLHRWLAWLETFAMEQLGCQQRGI